MNNTDWQVEFDTLVRDITQVGFMAKSKAKKRLKAIIDSALKKQRQDDELDVRKMIDSSLSSQKKLIVEALEKKKISDADKPDFSDDWNADEGYNRAIDESIKLIEEI